MPDVHARLSASSSHRWLACPPSIKLCEDMPDTSTTYAQEGTDCHELCAYLVVHVVDELLSAAVGDQLNAVGLGEFVVVLFQLFVDLPQVGDHGGQRLLHQDEAVGEPSDAVAAPALGQRFVEASLGNTAGLLVELAQG